MKIAVCYLHVSGKSDVNAPPPSHYWGMSTRFVSTYKKFRGNTDHDLVVVSCGGPLTNDTTRLYCDVVDRYYFYNGGGWDIGAHQAFMLSPTGHEYDFVINMATPMFFWREGFIDAMVQAWVTHGNGLYGPTASYQNTPHIRTCCWATTPGIFAQYPHIVDTRPKTFMAESGEWSITKWYQSQGLPTLMVAADGFEYEQQAWRKPPNVFRRGDQSNCLVWDRHTEIYRLAGSEEKTQLEKLANGQ